MSLLHRIFETLSAFYVDKPPQDWWPENPLEVVVGAVLVQGAVWTTVARVLDSMRQQDLLRLERILEMDEERLIDLIRPVGFQCKKAARLKEVAALVQRRAAGDLTRFFARDLDEVRRDLLSVNGIGPGAADNILLYAGKFPIYMVDPFTVRILIRHGVIGPKTRNVDIQQFIHRELAPEKGLFSAALFRNYQSLIVRVGRDFCDKTNPRCDDCPLRDFLPEGGLFDIPQRTPAPARVRKEPTSSRTDAKQGGQREEIAPSGPPNIPLISLDELELSETERSILQLMTADPLPIDQLIHRTGLPVHIVRATIAVLEMRKILRQTEGNNVRRIC